MTLIVDKDGFFPGSYMQIFEPNNPEPSYETANLVLEDVDSAFEEVVRQRNKVLSRRGKGRIYEVKAQNPVVERIPAPSEEEFSKACKDYIRRSPGRYSCIRRKKEHMPSFRSMYALSEVSESTQQEISDTSSVSHAFSTSSIMETCSFTHQLASFAINQSDTRLIDRDLGMNRSRGGHRPPLKLSNVSSSRTSSVLLSTVSPKIYTGDSHLSCPKLLNNSTVALKDYSPTRSHNNAQSSVTCILSPIRSRLAVSLNESVRHKEFSEPMLPMTIKAYGAVERKR